MIAFLIFLRDYISVKLVVFLLVINVGEASSSQLTGQEIGDHLIEGKRFKYTRLVKGISRNGLIIFYPDGRVTLVAHHGIVHIPINGSWWLDGNTYCTSYKTIVSSENGTLCKNLSTEDGDIYRTSDGTTLEVH